MEDLSLELGGINEAIITHEDLYKQNQPQAGQDLAALLIQRGLMYFQFGLLAESNSDCSRAAEILEQAQREGRLPDENELAKAYACLGMVSYKTDDMFQALQFMSQSIGIWEGMLGTQKFIDKEMMLHAFYIRGAICNSMTFNMDEAISDYEKGISIAKNLMETDADFDQDKLALCYMGVGQSYDQKEDYIESEEYYDQAIEIWEKMRQKGQDIDRGNLAKAYMNRGANNYQYKEYKEAIADYSKCISIIGQQLEDGEQLEVFDIFMAYKNRARAFQEEHEVRAAIDDHVVATRAIKFGFNNHPELQELYYESLGETLELVENQSDKAEFEEILNEFFYPMADVPKTESAESAHEFMHNVIKQ